ncbi:MAG TPA: UDP-N-acetylmuramoyl-tripeptide--D-alanyl-D-alanine ligase [bacterium]|nr:UDP-N-acetylmuramoyl-tripeptide--D-alanyl-D-alanine ligase [bacterium]
MPGLNLDQIARITGARVAGDAARPGAVAGYAIDSRLLARGEIFFALKGDARDGHEFVADAFARGAVAAVVERPVGGLAAGDVQLVVPSPLEALQALAAEVRKHSQIPVIAITGSNGKTTTKEMLAHLLATRFQVRKSPGNFNNHIGLPLSILGLTPRDEILVVELGANHVGEIAALAKLARPDVAVVTNVGRAHVGLFGSVEAVAREKTDLVRSLGRGGRGVVNADDEFLLAALRGTDIPVLSFGIEAKADFRATDVKVMAGGSQFMVAGQAIGLRVPGAHNVYNALAAMGAASLFGVSVKDTARALPDFEPARMKTVSLGGLTLIDDTYNANPDSMAAALEVLAHAASGRRVLVMGEMLELGPQSESLHREVGSRVPAARVDLLVGIGEATRPAIEGAVKSGLKRDHALWYESISAAKPALGQLLRPGDTVLVKASRKAGLEEISDFLKATAVAGRT